jgi:UDP-N-acetylmuramoylalanine--D-glutamate ligase
VLRVLGKGKTAQAIKDIYDDVSLYDDNDLDIYDNTSNDITVVSPGIPPYNELVKSTINQISDYDLFLTSIYNKEQKEIFSIWISGTNGKTTTTQMCEHLLKDNNFTAAGNIGLPLAKAYNKNKNLILETSSFTLHYTSYAKPNIYVLLPISADHISWHGNYKEYEQSKLKPIYSLNEGEIAIVPYKYKDIKTNGYLITYKDTNDLAVIFDIDLKRINFKEPFLMDSVIALGIKKILFDVIDYNKINTFTQDPHKLEEFYDKNNRLWVDDSKATNVDATIQALNTYKDNTIHIILGGDDKGASLEELFILMSKLNINIYAIGANQNKIKELSDQFSILCELCDDIKTAVKQIKSNFKVNNNEVAILSPAAASLDQFSSYKQRGEKFKENVQIL